VEALLLRKLIHQRLFLKLRSLQRRYEGRSLVLDHILDLFLGSVIDLIIVCESLDPFLWIQRASPGLMGCTLDNAPARNDTEDR
jgi:hypothetical protein